MCFIVKLRHIYFNEFHCGSMSFIVRAGENGENVEAGAPSLTIHGHK